MLSHRLVQQPLAQHYNVLSHPENTAAHVSPSYDGFQISSWPN